MGLVIFAQQVRDGLDRLEPRPRDVVALELQSSFFDAADNLVAVKRSGARGAGAGEVLLPRLVGDLGGREATGGYGLQMGRFFVRDKFGDVDYEGIFGKDLYVVEVLWAGIILCSCGCG